MTCEVCDAAVGDYPIMITFTVRVLDDAFGLLFSSRKIETVYVCSRKCGAKFFRARRDRAS